MTSSAVEGSQMEELNELDLQEYNIGLQSMMDTEPVVTS
jgi:hypothetical protein